MEDNGQDYNMFHEELEASPDIKILKRKRSNHKGHVTTLKNFIEDSKSLSLKTLSNENLDVKISNACKYATEYTLIQKSIEELAIGDPDAAGTSEATVQSRYNYI